MPLAGHLTKWSASNQWAVVHKSHGTKDVQNEWISGPPQKHTKMIAVMKTVSCMSCMLSNSEIEDPVRGPDNRGGIKTGT